MTMGRVFPLGCCFVLVGTSCFAETIVFSAAHLREVHGKYFPIDSPHLYRIESDGNSMRSTNNVQRFMTYGLAGVRLCLASLGT